MTNRRGLQATRATHRLDDGDHSEQSFSCQPGSTRSERDAKREQKLKRQSAIKEVERHFVTVACQYILGKKNEFSLPDERGCEVSLKKGENLQGYLGRISTTVYQKLYNELMNQSQAGSSYSFNKRTSGNALDSNGIVFMKDLDIDHITRQAISIAFRKQFDHHQKQAGRTSATTHTTASSST